MKMIHSCSTWTPDLAQPAQADQCERNWPGLGATDAELASWARLYGHALLDALEASLGREKTEQDAYEEGEREGFKEAQDNATAYADAITDAIADLEIDYGDPLLAPRLKAISRLTEKLRTL